MHMPRTIKQKTKIENQIKALENKKKALLRNKDKYQPVKFYKELNVLNKAMENLEKKI